MTAAAETARGSSEGEALEAAVVENRCPRSPGDVDGDVFALDDTNFPAAGDGSDGRVMDVVARNHKYSWKTIWPAFKTSWPPGQARGQVHKATAKMRQWHWCSILEHVLVVTRTLKNCSRWVQDQTSK